MCSLVLWTHWDLMVCWCVVCVCPQVFLLDLRIREDARCLTMLRDSFPGLTLTLALALALTLTLTMLRDSFPGPHLTPGHRHLTLI